MTKAAPDFWQKDNSIASAVLWPISKIYRTGARLRQTFSRYTQIDVPVICVGNVVVGGAGKTPVCLEIARVLQTKNVKVHFCSKGYGGSKTQQPLEVKASHTASEVGDEALLLRKKAPVWVAKNRIEGVKAASVTEPDVIVMDDGMQNPTVVRDYNIAVVDGGYGFGNKKLLPAGPLREPVPTFLDQTNMVIIIGRDEYNIGMLIGLRHNIPILRAEIALKVPLSLSGKALLPFAGIGRPEKFFQSLEEKIRGTSCKVVEKISFPDHHAYSDKEIAKLQRHASRFDAQLVTTEKDYVRLSDDQKTGIVPIPMILDWQDDSALILEESLLNVIKNYA